MKPIVSPNRFYVYLYARNGLPFYVGKGSGERINAHFMCAHKHQTCKHRTCRIIRKAEREGEEITAVKIADGISEQASFKLERLFISYGVVSGWPLVNQTFGGEGTGGFRRIVSLSEREQRRQISMKRFARPGEKEKLSQGAKRRFSNPSERAKQSLRVLQHFSDPEVRKEHRKRAIERAALAPEISDEERQRRSQRALQQWSNADRRERRSQQGIQRYANPEERERSRQISRDLWQTPEYRDKMLAICRSPQTRAKMSQSRSEGPPNRVGTFEGFVSPQGVIYSPVVNLTAFCRDHGLSYCGMWLVAQGKQVIHKGWIKYNPEHVQPPLF